MNLLPNEQINSDINEIVTIVGNAPHELLVSSGNQPYMHSQHQILELR